MLRFRTVDPVEDATLLSKKEKKKMSADYLAASSS